MQEPNSSLEKNLYDCSLDTNRVISYIAFENSNDKLKDKKVPEQKSVCLNIILAITFATAKIYSGYIKAMFNIFGKDFVVINYAPSSTDMIFEQIGNINSAHLFGTMLGCLLGGFIAQSMGGVRCLITGEFLNMISFILLFYCEHNIGLCYVGRFASGIASGCQNIGGARCCKDILPRSVLNFGGILPGVCIAISHLIAAQIGNVFAKETLISKAPWFLVCPIIISIIRVLILLIIKVESPYWIVEKYAQKIKNPNFLVKSDSYVGSKSDSEPFELDQTEKLQGKFFVLDPVNTKRVNNSYACIYKKDSIEIIKEDLIKDMDEHFSRSGVSFFELFKFYWRKKMMICMGQIIYTELSGNSFFNSYSTILFNSVIPGSGRMLTLYLCIFKVLSLIPNYLVQKKGGRRTALLYGNIISTVGLALFVPCAYFKVNIVLLSLPILTYEFGAILGMASSTHFFMLEVMPASGLGLQNFLHSLVSLPITKYTPLFLTAVGPTWLMMFFGLCCFNAVLYIWAFIPEVKDKSRRQIHKAFCKI